MRLGSLVFLILLVDCHASFAQTTVPTSPSSPGTSSPIAHAAEPYSDDEFPPWVLKLRRFEIIAVGAFPLAYLFASVGYDYIYYVSNGLPAENIPWPAGAGTSGWTTASNPGQLQTKNVTLVVVSLGLSLAVAGLDWFLGLYE